MNKDKLKKDSVYLVEKYSLLDNSVIYSEIVSYEEVLAEIKLYSENIKLGVPISTPSYKLEVTELFAKTRKTEEDKKMKLKIFFDMDEVAFDLSGYMLDRVNKDFDLNFEKGFNKSYWWKDYGIDKSYFENILNEKGTFLKLKPNTKVIEMAKRLYELGYDIHILTAPQHNHYCFYEKILSIKRHLPFINIETNFHTSGSKYLLSKEGTILIDDNPNYIKDWTILGEGKAIVLNQPWNEDLESGDYYAKLNLNNFEDILDIIEMIEEEI